MELATASDLQFSLAWLSGSPLSLFHRFLKLMVSRSDLVARGWNGGCRSFNLGRSPVFMMVFALKF